MWYVEAIDGTQKKIKIYFYSLSMKGMHCVPGALECTGVRTLPQNILFLARQFITFIYVSMYWVIIRVKTSFAS